MKHSPDAHILPPGRSVLRHTDLRAASDLRTHTILQPDSAVCFLQLYLWIHLHRTPHRDRGAHPRTRSVERQLRQFRAPRTDHCRDCFAAAKRNIQLKRRPSLDAPRPLQDPPGAGVCVPVHTPDKNNQSTCTEAQYIAESSARRPTILIQSTMDVPRPPSARRAREWQACVSALGKLEEHSALRSRAVATPQTLPGLAPPCAAPSAPRPASRAAQGSRRARAAQCVCLDRGRAETAAGVVAASLRPTTMEMWRGAQTRGRGSHPRTRRRAQQRRPPRPHCKAGSRRRRCPWRAGELRSRQRSANPRAAATPMSQRRRGQATPTAPRDRFHQSPQSHRHTGARDRAPTRALMCRARKWRKPL